MAKKDNSAVAWAIGLGTLALAGVGIVLYEKSAGSTSSSAGPNAPAGTLTPAGLDSGFVDPNTNRNMDAIVATAVALAKTGHGNGTVGHEGNYWANLAKAHAPTQAQLQALSAVGY
jgi:hypothetical protein